MNGIILVLILIIPALAQMMVSVNYNKYKQIANKQELTGYDVARSILDKHDLKDMYIVETKGNLTDHYDPNKKVVRLSSDIYHGKTIAAMAVAAHECGHAIHIATSISYAIIALGLLLESFNLIWLGIACVGTGLLFQIVTLPVEINASMRAKKELDHLKLADTNEQQGVKQMLFAAASTYLAGVLSSALELVRLILILTNREER